MRGSRERKVIRQLQEAGKKVDGILVVINSYGGSLPVANNIASSLVSLRVRQYLKCHLEFLFTALQKNIV